MREDFEKAFPVPHGVYWRTSSEKYSGNYSHRDAAADEHTRKLEVWQAATALQAERVRELRRVLLFASCPEQCVNGAYHDHEGNEVRCQFCYGRKQALSATAREQGK